MTMAVAPDQGRLPPWGPLSSAAWLLLGFAAAGFAAVMGSAAWLGAPVRTAEIGNDGVLLAVGGIVSVPVEIAVLAAATRLRRWPVADYLALHLPRRGEVVLAVIAVILLGFLFNLLLALTGRDIVTPFQIEAYRSAKDAGWLLGLFVAIILFAPIGEEIAFRGFLFRGWALPGRELFAIITIALIWALLHIQYDWLGMVQIFAIGVVLGWFRWASGSTTLAILMHALVNLQAMIETAVKVEYLS
jgi:membrane protease YdiL (CAAX protease family)